MMYEKLQTSGALASTTILRFLKLLFINLLIDLDLLILLRIRNGGVDMNSFWLERIEMRVLLLGLQLEIGIENTTSF